MQSNNLKGKTTPIFEVFCTLFVGFSELSQVPHDDVHFLSLAAMSQ